MYRILYPKEIFDKFLEPVSFDFVSEIGKTEGAGRKSATSNLLDLLCPITPLIK